MNDLTHILFNSPSTRSMQTSKIVCQKLVYCFVWTSYIDVRSYMRSLNPTLLFAIGLLSLSSHNNPSPSSSSRANDIPLFVFCHHFDNRRHRHIALVLQQFECAKARRKWCKLGFAQQRNGGRGGGDGDGRTRGGGRWQQYGIGRRVTRLRWCCSCFSLAVRIYDR